MNTMFSIFVGLAIVYCFSNNDNYETKEFIRRQDKPMSTKTYEIKRKK